MKVVTNKEVIVKDPRIGDIFVTENSIVLMLCGVATSGGGNAYSFINLEVGSVRDKRYETKQLAVKSLGNCTHYPEREYFLSITKKEEK